MLIMPTLNWESDPLSTFTLNIVRVQLLSNVSIWKMYRQKCWWLTYLSEVIQGSEIKVLIFFKLYLSYLLSLDNDLWCNLTQGNKWNWIDAIQAYIYLAIFYLQLERKKWIKVKFIQEIPKDLFNLYHCNPTWPMYIYIVYMYNCIIVPIISIYSMF